MKSTAFAITLLFTAGLSWPDTLHLKSGGAIQGTFLAGNTREAQFLGETGKAATFPLTDIDNVTFSASLPPVPAAGAPRKSAVLIPAATPLMVRWIDGVDVASSITGQTFRASIDDPIIIGDNTIVPRGAAAVAIRPPESIPLRCFSGAGRPCEKRSAVSRM